MRTIRVRAIAVSPRLLRLLDPVDLPEGQEITITIEWPGEPKQAEGPSALPARDASLNTPFTREDYL